MALGLWEILSNALSGYTQSYSWLKVNFFLGHTHCQVTEAEAEAEAEAARYIVSGKTSKRNPTKSPKHKAIYDIINKKFIQSLAYVAL